MHAFCSILPPPPYIVSKIVMAREFLFIFMDVSGIRVYVPTKKKEANKFRLSHGVFTGTRERTLYHAPAFTFSCTHFVRPLGAILCKLRAFLFYCEYSYTLRIYVYCICFSELMYGLGFARGWTFENICKLWRDITERRMYNASILLW